MRTSKGSAMLRCETSGLGRYSRLWAEFMTLVFSDLSAG